MGFHTFDAEQASQLERPSRYRWVSAEELIGPLVEVGAAVVADLGSGTGFYTDAVAEHAETVYGVDVQSEMHEYYRDKGLPENVDLVASDVSDLPLADGELDGACSTMTYHEFASPDAIGELARVLRSDGRLVVFDWSADGDGDHGPPVDERFAARDARETLADAGFEIERAETRTETFGVVARAP
ncbi:class I SAM-dependent methyltransferase [Halorubrum ezzemoulense]|jgi:SAM-dependent methyltransferase|uniref:SAM-dependent methyltransferase n=1 Tax=Halorubrum ezzemoulense TaxID=337243 RepID=A0A256JMR7_HALEZ|nr:MULTISPECIES: class I SAM-dependent methyltransferase [Halorubrum]MDB2237705.1 class I SAM-dependent methyltransferase [Halorubrum ezzemoulense]MDB2240701.1 class I SAM-dependent methyltransferase [Halorubrum ezzemoulense]MDB2248801.1 class I SAM-dependent methyltransferase [Halorubrum ezzemoulense]MDB2261086.1 class I SAM-dependent methyltransferase [Halorubrum ezzemoulense]MDB2264227.1 class I SAM-dependent methyltransferase [Halorubrum ezzemoulense]